MAYRTSTSAAASERELRLLIIGKTGNGKSTAGNMLLGRHCFKVGVGLTSTTNKAQVGERIFGDQCIKVIDTPDIWNMGLEEPECKYTVNEWKTLTEPYPHAILLAVRCDVRYTAEEHAIYHRIKSLWGDNFNRKLIVLFTFGDQQDRDIKEELSMVSPELKSVLRDAEYQYVVFNNAATDTDKKKVIEQLLMLVQQKPTDMRVLLPVSDAKKNSLVMKVVNMFINFIWEVGKWIKNRILGN